MLPTLWHSAAQGGEKSKGVGYLVEAPLASCVPETPNTGIFSLLQTRMLPLKPRRLATTGILTPLSNHKCANRVLEDKRKCDRSVTPVEGSISPDESMNRAMN